ncbi:hypothetical protein PBT90_08705 [Algoriphagus halophytocola]|uniref:Uncharacterized protein n=1 Tax=Algoriphagus halophytocola TaxID=2991499 RepID=A0ABY6MI45_9BACT|nr:MULTISPECIES: hypothetical protein [unclassified Algoriphagus]UZD23466.1 hypothetical protein OM944_03025 [Algoriphagus sp. TR-M5]WBL44761.1 hypothetical protein PBT90_08705 [Algoriphagus sp. TR-M9]
MCATYIDPPRLVFRTPDKHSGMIFRQDPSWPRYFSGIKGINFLEEVFESVLSTLPRGFVGFATNDTVKTASLLYDNVVLVHVSHFSNLYYDPLDHDVPYIPYESGVKLIIHQIRNPNFETGGSIADYFNGPDSEAEARKLIESHRQSLTDISDSCYKAASSKHLSVVPTWNDRSELDYLLPEENAMEAFSALMENVPQLDARNTSWEVISELKKDQESLEKVRRMRVWFHTEVKSKSFAAAQDLILSNMEDYKSSLKKHGASYKDGILEVFLKKENLTASIISALAGVQLAGAMEGIAAAGIPILGDLVLQIRKSNREKKSIQNHPFALLTKIEEASN